MKVALFFEYTEVGIQLQCKGNVTGVVLYISGLRHVFAYCWRITALHNGHPLGMSIEYRGRAAHSDLNPRRKPVAISIEYYDT